jgi:hypothetical protein
MLLVSMLVRHIVNVIGSSNCLCCCQFVVLLVLLLACHVLVLPIRCVVGKCHVINDVIGSFRC